MIRSSYIKNHKYIKIAILIIVLLVVSGLIFHLRHKTSNLGTYTTKSAAQPNASPKNTTTNNSVQSSSNSNAQTTETGGYSSGKAVYGSNSGGYLIAPSGDIISNHRPSSTDSQENSVCNTTPGAQCQISFNNGSGAFTLPTKTVGLNGSAYWIWTPDQIGLMSGSWSVTETATLNGQSKSIVDSQKLIVP